MLEGLYTALAGMEAQQRSTDAMANDIANLDTPGYKAEQVGFRDLLYSASGQGSGAAVSVRPTFGQGTLYSTGRPLDLAINGDGFFEVHRADGTRALTRDGAFELDPRGRLRTASGELLTPPVTLPAGTDASAVKIEADGTVWANGRREGTIKLVNVTAQGQLLAVGDGQFLPTAASGPVHPAASGRIHQGMLEASTASVTEMLGGSHAYSFLSEVVKTQEQMAQIANQLTK